LEYTFLDACSMNLHKSKEVNINQNVWTVPKLGMVAGLLKKHPAMQFEAESSRLRSVCVPYPV
jgi:hypothetical protein